MAGAEPSQHPESAPEVDPVQMTPSLSRWSKGALWLLRRLDADPDDVRDPAKGRFPSTKQSFLWDLAPHQVAPPGDGVVLPTWAAQPWLSELEADQVAAALQAQRRETRLRQEAVARTEEKASRLLTPFVALLTGAVALVAFQLSSVNNRDGFAAILAWFGVAFGVLGSIWLLAGLTRALDSDTRMGRSVSSTAEQEIQEPLKALVNEARAAQAARFVQQQKAERILFARAAISRSLVFLVVSAFCAALSLLTAAGRATGNPGTPEPASPTATVTVTVSPTATESPRVSWRLVQLEPAVAGAGLST
jgi:hypothetical protein